MDAEKLIRKKWLRLKPSMDERNKIEHRLFSFITMNWRGRPLRSYETIVNLIGNTTTIMGLVHA